MNHVRDSFELLRTKLTVFMEADIAPEIYFLFPGIRQKIEIITLQEIR